MMQDGQGLDHAMILVVDDNPKNLQLAGSVLGGALDCDMSFATGGAEALEIVGEVVPDLVLLDVNMPGMDGFEVCRRLKSSERFRKIPVIFLTARQDSDSLVRGFEAGAVDYVTKPFEACELLARVRIQLQIRRDQLLIERREREYRELLHMLCHDIQNPLGAAFTLLKYPDDVPVGSFEAIAPILMNSISQVLEIIKIVRTMSAIAEGKLKLRLDAHPVKALVGESLQTLDFRIRDKRLSVSVDVAGDISVMVEPVSFCNSVLNNALTNAVKFSDRGGALQISARTEAERVVLSVCDRGIGMSPALLQDLFDIRKPTSRPGTEGEPGTGFGMPLMKKLMEAYGGTVVVSSRPRRDGARDAGTEVKLFLRPGA